MGKSDLVTGDRLTDGVPGNVVPRDGEDLGHGPKASQRQSVRRWNAAAVELDLSLPDAPLRQLSLDDRRREAGVWRLNEEAGDPVFGSGPDDRDITDRRVADPALGPIENVVVAVTEGTRRQVRGIASVLRFGQGECANRLATCQRRYPARFLLLRTACGDGRHRQTGLNVEERGERRVDAAQLPKHETEGDAGHPGAAVSLHRAPNDIQRGELGQERFGKLGVVPRLPGHGAKRTLGEGTDPVPNRALLVGQKRIGQEEVDPR
jgi:hypothetical protein